MNEKQVNELVGWELDAGHGWLSVPILMARKVDGISEYSYIGNGRAYLEEDCDAPLFFKHYGIDSSSVKNWRHYDGDAPCKKFARFTA